MSVKPTPQGYHSITPYLIVRGVPKLLDFLQRAFGAELTHPPSLRPDGSVMHAEIKIGDSLVMMGEPTGSIPANPGSLYLYVEDVDATYRRALNAGAISTAEPMDHFYGDRSGGIKDPSGNQWWIATHKEDVAPAELARRQQAFLAQQASAAKTPS